MSDKVLSAAEVERLRNIEQAAHDLLCWTYQHAITVGPEEYFRNVRNLHPGVWNVMNASERDLYQALIRTSAALHHQTEEKGE